MPPLVDLTPTEFEDYVRDWLVATGAVVSDFNVTRLEHIPGAGGEYEIDVVARLTLFEGAELVVLVECKHHKNPIKRDVIMVLESKLRDTKAHKGMLFSTADFQSGATDFAFVHKIATLRVTDAGMQYLTRSLSVNQSAFSGAGAIAWLCTPVENGVQMSIVSKAEGEALANWLRG